MKWILLMFVLSCLIGTTSAYVPHVLVGTSDNINTAINQIDPVAGGTVELDIGTHAVNYQIDIDNRNNLILTGNTSTRTDTIVQYSDHPTFNAIHISNATSITLKDFYIKSTASGGSLNATCGDAVFFDDADYLEIDNMRADLFYSAWGWGSKDSQYVDIHDSRSYHCSGGFRPDNVDNSVVESCAFDNSYANPGVYYDAGCNNLSIYNSTFPGNPGGIRTYSNTNNFELKGNTISGSWGGSGHGIQLWGRGSNAVIKDNIIRNNALDGIEFRASASSYVSNNSIIKNNIIRDNGANGIEFTYQNQLTVSGDYISTITNNVISDNTGHGIQLDDLKYMDVTTSNNIIHSNNYALHWTSNTGNSMVSSYNCLYGNTNTYYNVSQGTGDIFTNPLFYDISSNDFHINSTGGTWNGIGWETMGEDSPCVDTGNPASDYSNEPSPNGSRVNIGAYGDTIYASKSSSDDNYTIGEGGVSWSTNSVYDSNITLVQCTGNIELQDAVPNYITKIRMDSNSLLDENTTSSNDGTNHGATYNPIGYYGGRFDLDGNNDYISIGSTGMKNTSGTILMWVNATNTSVTSFIFSHRTPATDNRIYMKIIDGNYSITLGSGANDTGYTVPLSEDHQYALSWTDANFKAYVDGVLKLSGTGLIPVSIDSIAVIGAYISGVSGNLNGSVDDFREYDYELSNADINQTRDNHHETTGNITANHNFSSGNETYKFDVNVSTPTNTNYTVWYRNNNTGSFVQLGGTYTGNQTILISGTKYQNTEIRIVLQGNTTETPELIKITFYIQTSTPGTSTIVIPANSWGMFNNWTVSTTFSQIDTNESNDVAYSYYNTTSGLWESYYVGYSWNVNSVIEADNSVMGFFNAQTTITANIVTPSSTQLYIGWNMLYVEGIDNETIADIKADIGVNCTDVWWFNSTSGVYSNTTTDTVQFNQGFLAYINTAFTWTRSDL